MNKELNAELTWYDLGSIAIITIAFILLTLKVDEVKTDDYANTKASRIQIR